MFCRKCGLKLKEGDRYCWKCGADIIVKPDDKSTVNSKWLTWVMIIVLVCCTGIVVLQLRNPAVQAKIKSHLNIEKNMNMWSSGDADPKKSIQQSVDEPEDGNSEQVPEKSQSEEVNREQQQMQEWMQSEEGQQAQQQMQEWMQSEEGQQAQQQMQEWMQSEEGQRAQQQMQEWMQSEEGQQAQQQVQDMLNSMMNQ